VNLVGLGVGPVVVGSLSDHLFEPATAIARAVGAYSIAMLIIALFSVAALRKRIR
jgi:hypothetical protein